MSSYSRHEDSEAAEPNQYRVRSVASLGDRCVDVTDVGAGEGFGTYKARIDGKPAFIVDHGMMSDFLFDDDETGSADRNDPVSINDGDDDLDENDMGPLSHSHELGPVHGDDTLHFPDSDDEAEPSASALGSVLILSFDTEAERDAYVATLSVGAGGYRHRPDPAP